MTSVYVASSWRNPWQPAVVELLRKDGHDVYDFRAPCPANAGFNWREIDPAWKTWNPDQQRDALSHPLSVQGFALDMGALRRAEACLLVLPCGSSAHLELGWACGAGKRTAILFPCGVPYPVGDKAVELFGHTLERCTPCPGCSLDLDTGGAAGGCFVPERLHRIEPELMRQMAGEILVDVEELRAWSYGLARLPILRERVRRETER